MAKQAIVWLKKPIKTSLGDMDVVIANVVESDASDGYMRLNMNDGLELVPDYHHVVTGENVDPALWALKDGNGNLMNGVLDARQS